MRIRIVECEGYYLVPEANSPDYHSGPFGDVDDETFGRWQAQAAQWEGLQAELSSHYHDWSAREFATADDNYPGLTALGDTVGSDVCGCSRVEEG